MRAAIEYATELFDPATIRDFLGRYLGALDRATADPDRPVPHPGPGNRRDSVA